MSLIPGAAKSIFDRPPGGDLQRCHASCLALPKDEDGGQIPSTPTNGSKPERGSLQDALDRFIGPLRHPMLNNQAEMPGPTGQPVTARVVKNPSRKAVKELADKGYTHSRAFSILPCGRAPRWLLPLGDTHRTLEGFRIYAPYGRTAQILKKTIAWLIKAGWNGRGWARVLVASRGPLPLEVLVREVTGEREPNFAMSLGVGGKFCKLTVQVMRPNGEILGYVKLPLTEAATQRVRHEAAMLERLCDFARLRPHIPKVLYAGEWADGFLLFQSTGPQRLGPIAFDHSHEEFLRTLWGVHEIKKPGRVLVNEVSTRWQKLAPLLDASLRTLGERALDLVYRELDALTIPCGISHGDFCPWNTRVDNGRLFVFDWESAAWGAPILWDVFHFHLKVTSLLGMKSGQECVLRRAPDRQASFILYLLNSISEYFEEAGIGHPAIAYRRQILLRELSPRKRGRRPSGEAD
jgi:hypothetical protein